MAHSTIENAHTCQRLAQQSRERLGLSLLNFWWSSLLSRHTIPRPFFYPGSRPRLCQWKFLSDCECRWFQKKNFVFFLLPPPYNTSKRGECLIIMYKYVQPFFFVGQFRLARAKRGSAIFLTWFGHATFYHLDRSYYSYLYIRAGRESLGLSTTLFLSLSRNGKEGRKRKTGEFDQNEGDVLKRQQRYSRSSSSSKHTQKTQERERRRDGIWWIEQGSPLFWNTLPI